MNDSKCMEFGIGFGVKRDLAPIGLASFPRSGSTWLRYLVEGTTGIFTGSFYYSDCLASFGRSHSLIENRETAEDLAYKIKLNIMNV